jgi:hypothetical protein
VEVLPEVNVEENLEAHLEGKAGRSSDASMKGPSKDSITPPKVIVDVASQTSVDMPCKVSMNVYHRPKQVSRGLSGAL